MEEELSSGDVIDQQPTDDVIVEGGDTPQEQAEPETTGTQEVPVQHQSGDDFWKNQAMEYKRKTENIAEQLPSIIEEALSKNQSKPDEGYTIEQLEQFAAQTDEPSSIAWARSEIRKKEKAELLQELEKREKETQKKMQEQQVRQQSEAAVLNDPKYAEAFTTLPNGQKTWNQNSQLAQLMGSYMSDPRLKDDPQAMSIAAKLARADLLDTQAPQQAQQLTNLKQQNASLKKQTMVEGSGVNHQEVAQDAFAQHQQALAQTGSIKHLHAAIKERMRLKNKG